MYRLHRTWPSRPAGGPDRVSVSHLMRGLGFNELSTLPVERVSGISPLLPLLGDHAQLFVVLNTAIAVCTEDYGMFLLAKDSARELAFLLGAEYVPGDSNTMTQDLADYMISVNVR